MKKSNIAILVGGAAVAMVAGSAMAQDLSGVYVNAGVVQNHSDATDTASINGKIGKQINPNFAVEAEGGFGISDDTVSGVEYKEKGNLGAYAVGKLPVNEKFSLLGRAGYHHVWAQAKTSTIKVDDDTGSFAVGAGAEYMFDKNNGIRADYTRYTDNDGVDNFGVSYVRKF